VPAPVSIRNFFSSRGQLSRQRLWHQADIRSAAATKTTAVRIRCCAL